jgi:hypothetical protein
LGDPPRRVVEAARPLHGRFIRFSAIHPGIRYALSSTVVIDSKGAPMITIRICTADIRKLVTSAANPKNFDLPAKMTFKAGLEVEDDLHKQIETDDRLANRVFDAVSKEYKACLTKVTNVTKFADKQMEKENRSKVAKQWEQDVARYFAEAEKAMLAAATKEINAWLKVRGDRKKYKIKVAATITVGSLALATATLGTAVAATAGGPGIVVAIYGSIKAFINLAKELRKLAMDMDKAENILKKDLDKIVNAYTDATKSKVIRGEMVAAAIEQLFTYQKASITGCEGQYATFHGKLAGVQIKCSEAGKKLHETLDRQTELEKKILDKTEKELKNMGYTSKKLPKLKTSLDKLADKTKKQLLPGIEKLYKRADTAEEHDKLYKKTLDALKAKKPEWVNFAEASLILIDLGMGAACTDFSAAEQVLVLVNGIGVEVDDLLKEKLEG